MILVVDNYDSFVDNLARHIGLLGRDRSVVRNDRITLDEIAALSPEAIVLSPGPCAPAQAGICRDLIRRFHAAVPILGVCLGHQCIGEAFGGCTVRSVEPMHGRASRIVHDGTGLFVGLPQNFLAGRYHSLISQPPAAGPLEITARVHGEDTIMAFRHRDVPSFGVQFHPESILTDHGLALLANFTRLADDWNSKRRLAA